MRYTPVPAAYRACLSVLALASAAFAIAAPCRAQDSLSGAALEKARPRFVAETTSISPGQTILVGVSFDIEPGWHTYWKGRNDTVPSPWIEFDVQEGFTLGELQWPAPHRHESPGGLLDHIYERQVTLVAPLTAPTDLRPGETARLAAEIDWTACADICLMAQGTISLDLPVTVEPGGPSSDAGRFAKSRKRLPRPPRESDDLEVMRIGGRIEIQVPDAARLAFYPHEGGPDTPSLLRDGAADGDRIVLRTGSGGEPLSGVLEIWNAEDAKAGEVVEFEITGDSSIGALKRDPLPAPPRSDESNRPAGG